MKVSPSKEALPVKDETKKIDFRKRGIALNITTDLMIILSLFIIMLMLLSKKKFFSFLCISPYSGNYSFMEYLLASAGLFALPAGIFGRRLISAGNKLGSSSKCIGNFAVVTSFLATCLAAFSILINASYENAECGLITLLSFFLMILATITLFLVILTIMKLIVVPKKPAKKDEPAADKTTTSAEQFTQTASAAVVTTATSTNPFILLPPEPIETVPPPPQNTLSYTLPSKKRKRKKKSSRVSDSISDDDEDCCIAEGFKNKCSKKRKYICCTKCHRASSPICACSPLRMGACTPCLEVCSPVCRSNDVCGCHSHCYNKDLSCVKASYERLMLKYGIQPPTHEYYYEEKHGDYRNSCDSQCCNKKSNKVCCKKTICQILNTKKCPSSSSDEIICFKKKKRS